MQVIPGGPPQASGAGFSQTKIGQDETISDNLSMTPLYQLNKKNDSLSVE